MKRIVILIAVTLIIYHSGIFKGHAQSISVGAVQVGPNQYAFQYTNNTNYGLYFNATNARYEFKDGNGQRIWSTHAITGDTWMKGNLTPQGALLVDGNKYAFQYSVNTNYGLYFNATDARYEFRDGSGNPVTWIDAVNGDVVVDGGLTLGYTVAPVPGTLRWNGTDFEGYDGYGWVSLTDSCACPPGPAGPTGPPGPRGPTGPTGPSEHHRIWDNDNDTEVNVERNPDEDIIRFKIQGNERWVMRGRRLEPRNNGGSIFIGKEAGKHDNGRWNYNIFIGDSAGYSNVSGSGNTGIGYLALFRNTTGRCNVAIGDNAMHHNTTGECNVSIGCSSLFFNLTGKRNTAVGYNALRNNDADRNTAVGYQALHLNTTGRGNTAVGYQAAGQNTTGDSLVALGVDALFSNTTGNNNISVGYQSLYNNVNGTDNIAIGSSALRQNQGAGFNIAIGHHALRKNNASDNLAVGNYAMRDNTTGTGNSAFGFKSLFSNTSGVHNTSIGYYAMWNTTTGDSNTAVGAYALEQNTTGKKRTAVGVSANSTGNNFHNSTGIGYNADCTAPNQVRIGNANVNSIGGFAAWTNFSDGRFKENVNENVPGLEFITRLRPVTYRINVHKIEDFFADHYGERDQDHWEGKYDKEEQVFTGFIAQEVEQAAKEIGYEFSGVDKPKNEHDFYGLRYAEFVVPLVKAVQQLSSELEELKEINEILQKQLEEKEEQLQSHESRISQLERWIQKEGKVPSGNPLEIGKNNYEQPVIMQNIPNPFSGATMVSFYLPSHTASAAIEIYNLKGEMVHIVPLFERGSGMVEINAARLKPGIYIYTLVADGKRFGAYKMQVLH